MSTKTESEILNCVMIPLRNVEIKDSSFEIEMTINFKVKDRNINSYTFDSIYTVKKDRSVEEIEKTIKTNIPVLKRAYEKELNSNTCGHGIIVVKFIIREDGSVPKCQVVMSTYCNPNFEKVIVDLISKLRFPLLLSTYDALEVQYPFVFEGARN